MKSSTLEREAVGSSVGEQYLFYPAVVLAYLGIPYSQRFDPKIGDQMAELLNAKPNKGGFSLLVRKEGQVISKIEKPNELRELDSTAFINAITRLYKKYKKLHLGVRDDSGAIFDSLDIELHQCFGRYFSGVSVNNSEFFRSFLRYAQIIKASLIENNVSEDFASYVRAALGAYIHRSQLTLQHVSALFALQHL